MNPLKKLAGQTGIYGLGIIARFFNYLLVPLHTFYFTTDQYGIVTEMYAYVAFLVVLLTYGMETSFFRFSTKKEHDPKRVFSTIWISVIISSLIFMFTAIHFNLPISEWLKYPNNKEYVTWFAIIVGLDAISSIPMARLRALNKPIKFAFINLINIAVNIFFNVFFIWYCMGNFQAGNSNSLIDAVYIPTIGVGYVFIANLIASSVKLLLLSPVLAKIKIVFDLDLWKKILPYALPILIAGLAGIANESIDRILIKNLLWNSKGELETMSQLGIYGANYKMGIIVYLFLQALRYAAEPFYFNYENRENAKEVFAQILKWVVIILSLIILVVILYLDLFKYFISNETYWVGLHIVPIILFAYLALGIYQNQSIWFKLTDKTSWGIVFTVIGAFVTISLNLVLIPRIGYTGAAWATLACYSTMAVVSMIIGQKKFYVPYDFGRMALYIIITILIAIGILKLDLINSYNPSIAYTIHTVVMISCVIGVLRLENVGFRQILSFLPFKKEKNQSSQ